MNSLCGVQEWWGGGSEYYLWPKLPYKGDGVGQKWSKLPYNDAIMFFSNMSSWTYLKPFPVHIPSLWKYHKNFPVESFPVIYCLCFCFWQSFVFILCMSLQFAQKSGITQSESKFDIFVPNTVYQSQCISSASDTKLMKRHYYKNNCKLQGEVWTVNRTVHCG